MGIYYPCGLPLGSSLVLIGVLETPSFSLLAYSVSSILQEHDDSRLEKVYETSTNTSAAFQQNQNYTRFGEDVTQTIRLISLSVWVLQTLLFWNGVLFMRRKWAAILWVSIYSIMIVLDLIGFFINLILPFATSNQQLDLTLLDSIVLVDTIFQLYLVVFVSFCIRKFDSPIGEDDPQFAPIGRGPINIWLFYEDNPRQAVLILLVAELLIDILGCFWSLMVTAFGQSILLAIKFILDMLTNLLGLMYAKYNMPYSMLCWICFYSFLSLAYVIVVLIIHSLAYVNYAWFVHEFIIRLLIIYFTVRYRTLH